MRGISAKDLIEQLAIFDCVRRFEAFSKDNDPYRKHDCGSFTFKGEKIFWKIDVYDRNCEYGSDDPGDPAKSFRVLTIMLASEY